MIDLHTHSDVSDGTDPPTEVVRLARAAGCRALALSDHDTLDHVAEARRAAAREGVRLVPACELSLDVAGQAPGSLHLLAYFVEPGEHALAARLEELRQARELRNARIVARLRGHGIDIGLDDVAAVAGRGVTGRPHIAHVLVDRGAASSIDDAFARWLAKGRPAYVERRRLRVDDALRLVRSAGGVSSLAHPATLGLEDGALDEFVRSFAELGLDAIESEYGPYPPERRAALRSLAARHGLVTTGGSDFHGAHKPGLAVGTGTGDLDVPDDLLVALEARRPT